MKGMKGMKGIKGIKGIEKKISNEIEQNRNRG
jgi:hypothetical protein